MQRHLLAKVFTARFVRTISPDSLTAKTASRMLYMQLESVSLARQCLQHFLERKIKSVDILVQDIDLANGGWRFNTLGFNCRTGSLENRL